MEPTGQDRKSVADDTQHDWSELMAKLDIAKPAHEIVSTDLIGKTLTSLDQWKDFYNAYSKFKGFSVRNDKFRKDKDDVGWQRRWVCSREGFRRKNWLELPNRQKAPRQLTRIGCKAAFTVTLNRQTNHWVATSFSPDHNHELASPSEIQFLRSHRDVPESMVEQAKSMRNVGIRTMSILDYIATQCGGRDRLPFLKKDFYNKLATDRTSVGVQTDSEGALGYLTCLAIRDGNFYCRFNVDELERLNTIFWSDSMSRKDYKIFGDVLAFDTTYRTNAYNKPLMIMVGVNHHFRTTVFGVALLADETTQTFTWVLQQFLDCMDGKQPKVVATDGDHAMRLAISMVFPGALHRLCAWHLETNAGSNVPDGEFKIKFAQLIYKFYTEEEFEESWQQAIHDHNLVDNAWAMSIYEKRKHWAETFLRGNFIGGMRTTQRCESMNSYMRRFLDSKHLLRDFVSQIDQGLQNIRYNEMQDDFTSKHTDPLIPFSDPLRVYYEQFAASLTREVYKLVAKEIEGQNSYSIASCEYTPEFSVYRLSRFRYGEIRHHIKYWPADTRLVCSCLLLETDGIPCRHIFTVMKHLSLDQVPKSLMLPRWRKDAKMSFSVTNNSFNLQPDASETSRLGILANDFNTLGFYASKFEDTYLETREQFKCLTEKFKDVLNTRKDSLPSTTNFDEGLASRNNIVRDPIRAKTKGREKEANKLPNQPSSTKPNDAHRKRCKICHELGHNKATCKKRNENTRHGSSDCQNNVTPTNIGGSAGLLSDGLNLGHEFQAYTNFFMRTTAFGESSQQCDLNLREHGHSSNHFFP